MRLALARKAAGFSGAQMARRMGVKTATLRKWEAGDSEPRANRLLAIAGVLNAPINWLLTGEGDGPSLDGPTGDLRAVTQTLADLRHLHEAMGEQLARLEAQVRDAVETP